MSHSFNRVTLIGNVGRDPEFKRFADNNEIASFSLATSDAWLDRSSGERKEKTTWHNIVVKNEHFLKLTRQLVTKGSRLLVEGQLTYRIWKDRSGAEKVVTEIVVGPFKGEMMLFPRERGAGPAQEDPDMTANDAARRVSTIDDGIPF